MKFISYEVSFTLIGEIPGIFLTGFNANLNQQKYSEVKNMPTSKKQLEKLNKVKKAKAEELSKQAADGSKEAQKKLKKLEKKLK